MRNVPKLRFKGFSDAWEEKRLGELVSSFEYGMNSAAVEFDGENKYIRITDIDEKTNKYVNENVVSPDGELDDKFLVKENDILFARTGASTGKSYLYDSKDGKLYFAGFLIRANVNKKNNAKFIFTQTQTANYGKWIKVMSMRSGQPGINAQEYASYCIKAPKLEEQEKIANFLTKVDKLIEKQDEKVSNLEQYKKGMIQKIFSQEIRFKKDDGGEYPEWERKQLKDIVVNKSKGGLPQYSEIDGNVLLNNEYLEGTNTVPVYVTNEINVAKNDVLILWDVSQSGKVYTGATGVLGSTFVSIKLNETNNNRYIYQLLNSKKDLIQTVWREGSGVPHVAKDFVENFKVKLPCLEEQTKIANFLSKIDSIVEKEKEKLEELRVWKKGLLQGMFV